MPRSVAQCCFVNSGLLRRLGVGSPAANDCSAGSVTAIVGGEDAVIGVAPGAGCGIALPGFGAAPGRAAPRCPVLSNLWHGLSIVSPASGGSTSGSAAAAGGEVGVAGGKVVDGDNIGGESVMPASGRVAVGAYRHPLHPQWQVGGVEVCCASKLVEEVGQLLQ